ncbi:hypothetical protein ACFQ08_03165 [Streptosporangium algeriense]|uniref:Uncharacterized protein n=1 Tax=Streptosporangium algeriense TaxID=1682748 RepID=A0ABW3DI34_9ACTN
MDQFPAEQGRDIRALERRIEALEALVREVKGVPVRRASGPFFLPNASSPTTPSGGVVFYSSGGSARWIDSFGMDRSLIPPPFPKGSSVSDPPPMTAFSAPASYNPIHSQSLRDDIAAVRAKLIELITSLEDGGLIFTA